MSIIKSPEQKAKEYSDKIDYPKGIDSIGAKHLAFRSYKQGVEDSKQWFKISEHLPEENEFLLDKSDEDTEKTFEVLVMTDCNSISENRRVKMVVENKEWVWVMGYEGESIIKWRLK